MNNQPVEVLATIVDDEHGIEVTVIRGSRVDRPFVVRLRDVSSQEYLPTMWLFKCKREAICYATVALFE